MNLEQKIEAILFYKNEPLEVKRLAKLLEISEEETKEALKNLAKNLKDRGICLIITDTEASLATSPEVKGLIEQIAKDEMSKDIGKAGLETLAIILYNGHISRREIDYIRGVNSTFILRNLCMRGLVDREAGKNQRIFKYKGSLSLLAHLGLKTAEELPEFDVFRKKIVETLESEPQTGSNENEQGVE
jgi:segregation and condensation protein B